MNAERMRELADYIEGGKKKTKLVFDMKFVLDRENSCGTSACIAGHVVWQEYGEASPSPESSIWSEATRLLGLTKNEAFQLFHPQCSELFENRKDLDLGIIRRKHAVAALRASADAGHIVWPEVEE